MEAIRGKTFFVDTETTGFKAPAVVVISFAELGKEPVMMRCKPRKPIELDATVVNGIRDEHVAHLPLLAENVHFEFIKSLLESNTLVAHNAPYDRQALANEGIFPTDWIDTKELAKAKWPDAPSHRLQHLYHWLKLEGGGAPHTADGDVLTLMALWNALYEERPPSRSPALGQPEALFGVPGPAPRETRRAILRKRIEGRKLPPKRKR